MYAGTVAVYGVEQLLSNRTRSMPLLAISMLMMLAWRAGDRGSQRQNVPGMAEGEPHNCMPNLWSGPAEARRLQPPPVCLWCKCQNAFLVLHCCPCVVCIPDVVRTAFILQEASTFDWSLLSLSFTSAPGSPCLVCLVRRHPC